MEPPEVLDTVLSMRKIRADSRQTPCCPEGDVLLTTNKRENVIQ